MPAHTDAEVDPDPRPLNPAGSYGLLPVLAFPGQELALYGDLFALPGDNEATGNRDLGWEPGQH